jgi:hypothetical protein
MTDRDEPVSDRAEPEPAPEAGGIRLVNLGGAGMLPALAAGVREAGLCLGLDPAPANALQIACQLMMRLIAAANMREGRLPHFELEVLKRPGAVVVRIDDEGLPYELTKYGRQRTASTSTSCSSGRSTSPPCARGSWHRSSERACTRRG